MTENPYAPPKSDPRSDLVKNTLTPLLAEELRHYARNPKRLVGDVIDAAAYWASRLISGPDSKERS